MHLVMVTMKQQMATASNDVHRFNQIGGIPAGEKSNLRIVFSFINKPYMLIKNHDTDQEVCIW
jgi:hypothetical protein